MKHKLRYYLFLLVWPALGMETKKLDLTELEERLEEYTSPEAAPEKTLLAKECTELIKNDDIFGTTSNGSTLLHFAAQCGLIDSCNLLIDAGAEIDKQNDNQRTPLSYVYPKSLAIIKLFINNGANPNAKTDQDGLTLLHYAARENDRALATFLLEKEADCAVKAKDGITALYAAVCKGHTDIASV